MEYYRQSVEDVFKQLNATTNGLSTTEAKTRREQYGKNALPEKGKKHPVFIFLGQFTNYLILILAAAGIISIVIGETIEGIAIIVTLIINAIVGFVQEYRAEQSIESLKKLTGLKAKVLRDGQKQEMHSEVLVPGDIIFLEAGDKVPADARIIEEKQIRALEASLTGESQPAAKNNKIIEKKATINDQKNMLFSGTIIAAGRATALVVRTGEQTEIGRIALEIQGVSEQTPLQKKLKELSKRIGIIVLGISIIVFLVTWFKGEPMFESFITAVALAVAAIPEGLPIVVTLTSAIGIQRMIKKNVLIRKLSSVETLGCTTVICTDKTGTLTCNEMTVREIFVQNKIIKVAGDGFSAKGEIQAGEKVKQSKEYGLLFRIGALCNDASMNGCDESTIENCKKTGDPTEIALIVSSAKAGLDKLKLENENPRIGEVQFSSERKIMTTVHKSFHHPGRICYTKGAPEIVLNGCSYIIEDGKVRKITKHDKKAIEHAGAQFASRSLRVLAFAYKEIGVHEAISESIERGMVFVGLQAMLDPPRKEVADAIQKCRTAGIKVVMITGDNEKTAAAIGTELGLEAKIMTGTQIEDLPDLKTVVEDIIIFARVAPEHKTRIVEALKSKGQIVAMTGDGVNDAPALKKADIGIAMGIAGTDVAKDASDMIITDDNFASIVNAVEQGRGIYNNILRFLRFQLSTNTGAILTVIGSVLLSLPLPLTALQLLWINVIVDGPPALSLGMEKIRSTVMTKPPRDPKEPILSKPVLSYVWWAGLLMAIGTLGVFYYGLNSYGTYAAMTMAFTTFVFFQLFNVLNCRSQEDSLFKIGFFTNPATLISIVVVVAIQLLIIYTPIMREVFRTTALDYVQWSIILIVSSTVLVAYELVKLIRRAKNKEKVL